MKVLFIGFGSIAAKHLKALQSLNIAIECYALRSSLESKPISNVKSIYDLSELPVDPDFVIISSPSYLHQRDILRSLAYDCPLFIEKPPVLSISEFESLSEEIGKRKIITYVGCNLRFLDGLVFTRDYLTNNELVINEVNIYAGSYLPNWRPTTNFRESYSSDSKMGGGVHQDLYHEFDYLYWLFEKPIAGRGFQSSKSSLSIDSMDYCNYHFEYKTFNASVILNYYRTVPKRVLEVVTDSGIIIVDLLRNEITLNDEIIYNSDQTILDTYQEQMKFFVESIPRKEEFNSNFAQAKNVIEMIELC